MGQVHPKCCENAKLIRIYWKNPYTESKTYYMDTKPQWFAMFPSPERGETSSRWMTIEFCPFCGQKLPDVRLKKKFPKKVMTMVDGGYYCDTCQKRLMSCTCSPPESMWELAK